MHDVMAQIRNARVHANGEQEKARRDTGAVPAGLERTAWNAAALVLP